jgi:hypothetical protein
MEVGDLKIKKWEENVYMGKMVAMDDGYLLLES